MKNSFKLFHGFVLGHLKTETFVIMYLQQKCQKQKDKKRQEERQKDGRMFYIFATKLTNFLLCGDSRDRNKRAEKRQQNAGNKAKKC